MALACKLCGAAVTALESVRCRQCRRLVCPRCVAEQSSPQGGAVCRECISARQADPRGAAADEAPSPASPGRFAARLRGAGALFSRFRGRAGGLRRVAKAWRWGVLLLLLGSLFLLTVFWPLLRARMLRWQLAGPDAVAAAAAQRELAARGGRAVYREMADLILSGAGEARLRAIEVMGDLGEPAALPLLRELAHDPRESELAREFAAEAVVKIEQNHFFEERLNPSAPSSR